MRACVRACVRARVLVLLQSPAMSRGGGGGVVRGLFVIGGWRVQDELRGHGKRWRVKYIFHFLKIYFFAAFLGERVWEKKSVG